MADGPSHPETDCFHAAGLNHSLNPYGSTLSALGPVQNITQAQLDTNYNAIVDQNPSLQSWPKIVAASCGIGPCVKSYTAQVRSGLVKETLVREINTLLFNSNSSDPEVNTYVPMICTANSTEYQITDLIRNFQDIERNQTVLLNLLTGAYYYEDFRTWLTKPEVLDECTFTIDMNAYQAIEADITDYALAGGNATLVGSGFRFNTTALAKTTQVDPGQHIVDPWNPPGQVVFDGTILSPFFADGNMSIQTLNQTMQQIAMAMTNHMRLANVNRSQAEGDVYAPDTIVHVNFFWLILPTALVVAGCCFLTLVAWQSHVYSSQRLWKSSQMALLYHGLQHRDELGPLTDRKEMEATSKALHARLGEETAGWRLVPITPVEDTEMGDNASRSRWRLRTP